MRLKTTITFRGTLAEIVRDLELWRNEDKTRAKILTAAPARLIITQCNYPTKSKRATIITGQREIWPEERQKVAPTIAEQLAE